MAYESVRMQYPNDTTLIGGYTYSSALQIDATGEKIAMIGRFWNASRTGKSIRKVGFRFGAVTKAGGSALTVSLQNVSTTATPNQPDGTPDQTVAIANGDASFASNTWITTGNLSADRAVAFGELLAVVIEFDGSGRLGSDSVVVSVPNPSGLLYGSPGCSLFTSSWAASVRVPNLIFECSDSSLGGFDRCPATSELVSMAFNSGSTPDEIGNVFQVPFACKTDGAWFDANLSGGNCEAVLYSGTTALATVAIDAQEVTTSLGRTYVTWSSEIELAANTDYILAIKPTTVSNISFSYFDVALDAYLDFAGFNSSQITRTDAGSWGSRSTTRRMACGINISAIDTGGASGVRLATFNGGFR